jgi:hypothetical protein
MVVIAFSAVLFLAHPAFSQGKSPVKDVSSVISEAREQVLKILQSQNACTAWFQETDAAAAEVFDSLLYELDEKGTSEAYRRRDEFGEILTKHPWGASAPESGGKAAVVTLNRNGPFFKHFARMRTLNALGAFGSNENWDVQMVGPYSGDTPQVRVLILLHELGHVIGRLPVDDASWNGDSSRNTAEVLRHCRHEIQLTRQKAGYAKK